MCRGTEVLIQTKLQDLAYWEIHRIYFISGKNFYYLKSSYSGKGSPESPWGLSPLASGRGETERWSVPPCLKAPGIFSPSAALGARSHQI